jgi:PAS domain S-box-containing protein
LDITERKWAEEALQESERQFREVLENVKLIAVTLDLQGNIIFCNDFFLQLTGWRRQEIAGREWFKYFVPDDIQELLRIDFKETIPSGAFPPHIENDIVTRTGKPRSISWSNIPLRDIHGEIVGITSIGEDITERKEAEASLREERNKFAKIVATTPGAICMFCRRPDGSTYFPYASPAIEDVYGLKSEELALDAAIMRDRIHPDDLGRVREAILESARTLSPWRDAYRYQHPKKGEVWIESNFLPSQEAGGRTTWYGLVTDITERKRAEDIIKESARVTSELLEKMNEAQYIAAIGSWEWNLLNDEVWWSDETYRIFGVKPQEFIPSFEANGRFIHPDDLEKYHKLFEHSLQTGEPLESDFRLVTNEGLLKHSYAKGNVISDATGHPTRFVGTIMDITERKQAEEALAASREQLAVVLDNVGIGISLLSPEMRVMELNRKMRDWFPAFPVDAAPLCYQAYNDPPREAPCSYCPCIQTLQDGQVHEGVTDSPSAEGTRHYRIVASPIRDAAGNIVSVIEMVDDITERKQAELALLRVNRALRVLSESNEALVRTGEEADLLHQICANLAESGGYRFAWVGYKETDDAKTVRPAASAGIDAEYLREIHISWGDNPNGQGPTGRAIRSGQPQFCRDIDADPGFALWREAAQKYGFASSLALPLVAGEKTFGALNIYSVQPDAFDREEMLLLVELANDLAYGINALRVRAEHRQAEEEIRKLNAGLEQRVKDRTAQLEALNRDLESFSYSVSHDLRAPLRSIDGFSLALLEEYQDKLGSQGKKDLERVRAAAQRMGELIEDLLNLSRVSRAPLHWEKVNLSKLAGEIADELQRSRQDRKVKFYIEKGLTVNGDPALLRSVMENLLSNAWKFTGRRETAKIAFGGEKQPQEVVYFVRDDGAGFDPAYVHKLFGVFQRLHSTAEFPGTGIGLATVQRIIRRHNGRIWAEGELNKGATFYFTLGKEPGEAYGSGKPENAAG